MTEIYDACRWVNQYLGVIGCLFVMWRLVPLIFDRERWRTGVARHRILGFTVLAGFELLSAFAAAHYDGQVVAPAQWFSVGFSGLHLATIALCVWWPHASRLSPT